jgi:hypothetical protein|tara:strand:+ start:374 stop:523 length:150 start_codon:yes stop_codon:yes gene_type:complete
MNKAPVALAATFVIFGALSDITPRLLLPGAGACLIMFAAAMTATLCGSY